MVSEIEKTRRYHLIKDKIPSIVRRFIKKEDVLYGGKAINSQVLPYLRTNSKDFDVFTENPKQKAVQLEKELDKSAGADIFSTEQAKHKETFKVKDLRGETVADFTKKPSRIGFRNLSGINIETLKSMQPKIRKAIRSPSNAYRREKDKDNLNRIKLMRKLSKSFGKQQ